MCGHVKCEFLAYFPWNRTQSNRKDSKQCFRPEIHGELFLTGLVCGKEVLSSGYYKVFLNGDSTLELAWSLSGESLALNTQVAPQGDLASSQLVYVLDLILLKEVQHQGSSWLVFYSVSSEKTVLWVGNRMHTYFFFPIFLGNTSGDSTGDRSTSGWSPAVPGSWQWHFCLAAVCTGTLCLLNTAGAVSGWRSLRVH